MLKDAQCHLYNILDTCCRNKTITREGGGFVQKLDVLVDQITNNSNEWKIDGGVVLYHAPIVWDHDYILTNEDPTNKFKKVLKLKERLICLLCIIVLVYVG